VAGFSIQNRPTAGEFIIKIGYAQTIFPAFQGKLQIPAFQSISKSKKGKTFFWSSA
jgi:hypothetical protein